MSTEEAEPLADAGDAADAAVENVSEQVDAVADAAPAPEPAPQPTPFSATAPTASGQQRPEVLIGGAFLGGMILAKLLGRRHG